MATQTYTRKLDDIDQSEIPEDSEPLKFGVEGTWYQIDVSDTNRNKFEKALKPFLDNGRRVGGKAGGTGGGAPAKKAAAKKSASPSSNGANTSGYSNKEIRDWARTNDIEVPERGRISQEVIDQFVATKTAE